MVILSNTHEAGVRFLNALSKHSELIMDAYSSPTGGLRESEQSLSALEELRGNRVMNYDPDDGVYRLRSAMRGLIDHGLKQSRLKMINANIGESFENVLMLAQEYQRSKHDGNMEDTHSFLRELRENVFELCDQLEDQNRDIWEQIRSNFGAVSTLSSKISLNANALKRVRQMHEALRLIDLEMLYQVSRGDRELLRLLHKRLRGTIDTCRQELGDAVDRLNTTMYALERLAARARMVARHVAHLKRHPEYKPHNYVDMGEVPEIFTLAPPMILAGSADILSADLEADLGRLLVGARAESVGAEPESEPARILVNTEDQQSQELVVSVFQSTVRDLFASCIEQQISISGLSAYNPELCGEDPAMWLIGLFSEHSSMEALQKLVRLDYVGAPDPVYNGNFIAKDIVLCPI